MFKLPLLLYCAYFFLRRRWRIVAGGAMSMSAVGLLSLALFGVEGHLGWYSEWVAPFLHAAMPAFNVQSIDGFLIRLTADVADLRDWEPREPLLAHRIARTCAFAVLFGAAFWTVWRGAGNATRVPDSAGASARDFLEFSLVLALALITSPVSWTHYYLLLLLPWGLYLGGQLDLPDDGTTRWLMRIGFTLAALPVIMPAEFVPSWPTALLARTVVSAWLFGGLLMFAALARGAWLGDIMVADGLRGEQR
jgi:alpha-1,2-mannosyltransferase